MTSTIFWRLARLGLLLLLGEAKLAVVEDLADRRDRVRDDLDEIEPGLVGDPLRFEDLGDAPVLTFGIDELHFAGADVAVDLRAVLLRDRGGFHGSTNGSLLEQPTTTCAARHYDERPPQPKGCKGRLQALRSARRALETVKPGRTGQTAD